MSVRVIARIPQSAALCILLVTFVLGFAVGAWVDRLIIFSRLPRPDPNFYQDMMEPEEIETPPPDRPES